MQVESVQGTDAATPHCPWLGDMRTREVDSPGWDEGINLIGSASRYGEHYTERDRRRMETVSTVRLDSELTTIQPLRAMVGLSANYIPPHAPMCRNATRATSEFHRSHGKNTCLVGGRAHFGNSILLLTPLCGREFCFYIPPA